MFQAKLNPNWSRWDLVLKGSLVTPCNNVIGTFCTQDVTETFSSWDDLQSWETGEAAQFAAANSELQQAQAIANALGLSLDDFLAATVWNASGPTAPFLQGGNWNFYVAGSFGPPSDGGCGAFVGGIRCGTFPSLHFENGSETGFVHLDSANPNPLNTFGFGTLVHGVLDYLLGNTIFSATGNPW